MVPTVFEFKVNQYIPPHLEPRLGVSFRPPKSADGPLGSRKGCCTLLEPMFFQSHSQGYAMPGDGHFEGCLLPPRLYVEERLYTHPLFELARSDTSRVVDRNGASTRWDGGKNPVKT